MNQVCAGAVVIPEHHAMMVQTEDAERSLSYDA